MGGPRRWEGIIHGRRSTWTGRFPGGWTRKWRRSWWWWRRRRTGGPRSGGSWRGRDEGVRVCAAAALRWFLDPALEAVGRSRGGAEASGPVQGLSGPRGRHLWRSYTTGSRWPELLSGGTGWCASSLESPHSSGPAARPSMEHSTAQHSTAQRSTAPCSIPSCRTLAVQAGQVSSTSTARRVPLPQHPPPTSLSPSSGSPSMDGHRRPNPRQAALARGAARAHLYLTSSNPWRAASYHTVRGTNKHPSVRLSVRLDHALPCPRRTPPLPALEMWLPPPDGQNVLHTLTAWHERDCSL